MFFLKFVFVFVFLSSTKFIEKIRVGWGRKNRIKKMSTTTQYPTTLIL